MVVVSHPLKEVVGGGSNGKAVKDCSELFLSERGIEQLGGFSSLVNLEVLWINGNKLKAITHLDSNKRIKELYAHGNHICTLKGSLHHFKFLQTLDLSDNELRDLEKVVAQLQQFHYLQSLNLKGNPCCEEPDYRLVVIHHMPWLHVLDQHLVTNAERRRAKTLIGGDVVASTVAFGKRAPNDAREQPVGERSVLEQKLGQAVAAIRDHQMQQAEAAERALYANNPSADYYAARHALPLPPGLLKAQQAWAASTTASQQHAWEKPCNSTAPASGLPQHGNLSSEHNDLNQGPSSSYVAKDVLVLSSCRHKGQTQALAGSQLLGTITDTDASFDNASHYTTFRHHMTDGRWSVCQSIIKL